MGNTQEKIRDGARVVVVGGAGFLGSHLVNHLIEDRKCAVLVLDNLITGRKAFIHPEAKFEWFDITGSETQLIKILKNFKAQYVFNYAAEPYIPVSFERPMHVFNINAMGALRVLNASESAGVKKILQVSSAEIYGDARPYPIKETDNATPHSTYGAAKLAIDSLVQCRWKESKTPAIAMRQFNCVGERETHPYIIPEIITQLSRSRTVRLGNNSFRDFQYAGDAVAMAVELLENGECGEVYNMGSEGGVQMYDLAALIGRVMGYKDIKVVQDPKRIRPWEIWHLQSDNSKLYETISYRPKTDLVTALRKTVEYYKNNNKSWGF